MRKWKVGIIFVLGTLLVPINTTSEQRYIQPHVMIQQTQSMISQLPTIEESVPCYTCDEPKPWLDIQEEVAYEPEPEPITEESTTEAIDIYEPEPEVVEETIVADAEVVTGYVVPFQWGCSYYATMQLTAYYPTGSPCADGEYPSAGYTAACNDPNLWHKWVYIEGVGDRYIQDTGGMSSDTIDIFFGSYSEAVNFGRWSSAVYVYE